jgi:transposase
MSVYVGIDVHRKRSQVAVVAGDGKVQLNWNVVNGQEPMLRLIGGLPAGTPVAFEAAYGWGWLVELLEDYGFEPHLVHPLRCKAIASARLNNDKVDAAILAQLRARAAVRARAGVADHVRLWVQMNDCAACRLSLRKASARSRGSINWDASACCGTGERCTPFPSIGCRPCGRWC